ncbi:MAG TPA: hypothetical protein ENI11_03090 [Actinobacteria bacterium]|nr:hypothetical protein [Actinomycetota bacterium]
MNEIISFFNRIRGYLADPRNNGPELLVSVGLLLVVVGMLVVSYLWIRFRLTKRKYKVLRRMQKEAEDQKPSPSGAEDTEPSSGVSESDYRDPEAIAEASGAGRLDPAAKADASRSDLLDSELKAHDASSGFWRRRRRRWWFFAIPLILLTLLAVVVTVPRYTMGKVSYCANCHSMRKAVKSWRASTHSKVACQKCHEAPGIYGSIMSQVQGLSNLSLSSLYWRRHRPVVLKTPVSPGCLSCHEEVGRTIIKFKDSIRISHKEFIYSMGCEVCHPAAGHAGKKLKIKTMDVCVTCHAENNAAVTCVTCHEAEPVWSTDRLLFYEEASNTFRGCRKCHPSAMRCEQCHEEPDEEE